MADILGQARKPDGAGVTVPPEYLAHLIDVVSRFGVRAEQLLRGTSYTLAQLERTQQPVQRSHFLAVVERALALSGEPGLGYHYGLSLKLSSHGPLGLLAMTSQTLRDAVSALERYVQLRGSELALHSRVQGDDLALEFVHNVPQPLQVFFTEAFFATLLHIGRALVGRAVPGVCEFAFAEPLHFRRFMHLLPGATVRFQAAKHRLLIPAAALEMAVVTSDSVMARRVERECRAELARLEERASFLAQVRRDVLTCADGYPSLEQVAALRATSTRTLKRKLAEQGTSYRQLVDQLRRDHAVELLRGSDHSIERVAELLGYSDPASFHRAFRRWFPVTPERFRQGEEGASAKL